MIRKIRMFFRLYRALYKDKRVPALAKSLPFLALLYIIVPIDLIPDVLPPIGQLDDLLSIPTLIWVATKLIPDDVYNEYKRKLFGEQEPHP